jgi:1-acyl-sn-glycerol-3-phosphate acyltransferase
MQRLADIVRSLAFYIAFYLGGAVFIVIAALMIPAPRGVFRRAVRNWAGWHRLCAP